MHLKNGNFTIWCTLCVFNYACLIYRDRYSTAVTGVELAK